MRHRWGGRKLGRPTSHRKALLRNQSTDLLRYEKIQTTEAKAKELRSAVEHLITLGKRGDLHARRQAYAYVYDKRVVDKLFHELAPRFQDRPGGYTRIVRLGFRRGDAAPMVQIELV
ncbi:MAG: 50S ribosomal protein L17 [Chloroflexi bacterium]|nr:50S ribosomal protein L17 [Chloroflexota bacterium]